MGNARPTVGIISAKDVQLGLKRCSAGVQILICGIPAGNNRVSIIDC